MKRFEESLDTELSPGDRKQIQLEISANKVVLENVTTEEQQRQTEEMEAEEQLRTEQAKLTTLEERLDRLEKALDNSPH